MLPKFVLLGLTSVSPRISVTHLNNRYKIFEMETLQALAQQMAVFPPVNKSWLLKECT